MGEPGGPKRIVVQIPSALDVEQQSSIRAEPLNLFRPTSTAHPSGTSAGTTTTPAPRAGPERAQAQGQASTSFTEAFSFVRNTEFYSPPVARPPPTTASATSSGSGSVKPPGSSAAATAQTGQARNAILVSKRQQGNSILKHIRNARWIFSDVVPDYVLGQNSCALYLSLRYHLLHPEYIYFRIRELQKNFRLRVVLCHVDVDDVIKPLHEVTKTCLLHDCSLLCAWSQEECARYLETIKIYENKPADYIQERTDSDYISRLTNSLTTVRHVNKTDVITLGSTFKTLSAIFNSSMEDLSRCPGIGERKVKRLYDAFNEPFRRVPLKLAQQSQEKRSGKDVHEGQTPAPEAPEAPEGNTEKEGGLGSEEAVPVSKLISRDDDVSVRDALNAFRFKSTRGRPAKLDASHAGLPAKMESPTEEGPGVDRKEAPSESKSEEYVVSLDD